MESITPQGAVLTMICHGLSTGGLFILVVSMAERMHTRELGRMGGLWSVAHFRARALLPWLSRSARSGRFCGRVSGFAGFLPEQRPDRSSREPRHSCLYFLCAADGAECVSGAKQDLALLHLSPREGLMAAGMIVGLLWLGLYPQTVFNTFAPALDNLQRESPMPVADLRRS